MQTLKNTFSKSLLALLILTFSTTAIHAQKLDKVQVQNLINSKSFVFKAQTVLPMTGMSRQLTSDYDVRLSGDSVVTYLPYFGRAYSVSYGEPGGINFTSTKFDYKIRDRKKGGWDLIIKTDDVRDIQQLIFAISENGYATLQVISNNRQPISFNGYIVRGKK